MAGIGNFLGGTAEGFNASMKNVIASQSVSRARKADKLSAKVAGNKAKADLLKEATARYDKLIGTLREEAKINLPGTLELIGSPTFQTTLQTFAKSLNKTPQQVMADLTGQLSITANPETRAAFERFMASQTAAGTAEGTIEGKTTQPSLVAGAKLNALEAVGAGQVAGAQRAATIGADVAAVESGTRGTLDTAAASAAGQTAEQTALGAATGERAALDQGLTVGTAEAQMADIEKALGRKLTDEDKERLVGLDNVAKTEVGKLIDDMGLYESGTAEHAAIAKMLDNTIASPGDKQASKYLAWKNEFTNLVGRKPNPAEVRAHLGAEPKSRGELSQLQMGVELAKEMFPDVDGKKSPQVQRAEEALANVGAASLTEVAGIRKEFVKASGEFVKLSNAWQKIQRAGMNKNAMGDLALIFMFMKVLDPPSTVREGEARAVATSGQLGEGMRAWLERAIESKSLTDTQRNELISTARDLYREQLFNQLQLEGQYGNLADKAKVGRDEVVLDYLRADDRVNLPTDNIFDPAITKEGVANVARFVMPLVQVRSGKSEENRLGKGHGFSHDFMKKLVSKMDEFNL